jgi:hypothetical protein
MSANIQLVNTTRLVACHGQRDAFRRAGNFTDWTEVRIGVFATVVKADGSDAACVAETKAYLTALDAFAFGLKDDSDILPALAGSLFLGMRGPEVAGRTFSVAANASGAGALGANAGATGAVQCSWNGATELTTSYGTTYLTGPFPQWSSSNPCGFWALKFVVSNKGGATQTVAISASSSAGPVSDLSRYNLRAQLEAASSAWGVATTCTWNAGGVALPMPCQFYLRAPYLLNRLRVATYDIMKFR